MIGKSKLSPREGFTLVELMVVIVILGTLMTILFVSLSDSQPDTCPLVDKANMSKIDLAMFQFKSQCGRYPTPEEGLQALIEGPSDIEGCAGRSFTKAASITSCHKCQYSYRFDEENGQYKIINLGSDCQEGGEGNKADVALDEMQ